jgi:glycosyltransferase involved in cell wall biosynthesis
MTLGYLVSEYPTPGHRFMLREITRLRQAGVVVHVAAIRCPGRAPVSEPERDERANTFYVTRSSPARLLRAHARALIRRPLAYLGTLVYAATLGHWHPRRTIAALAYFAEAVIAGEWLRATGAEHVHAHFCSTVALLAARVSALSLSITFHGPDEFDTAAADLIRDKMARSTFVVAISQFARTQIMRRSAPDDWPKIEVVPLGVDPASLVPGPEPRAAGPFRLLCAGRLAPVKGHRVLLEALARLVAADRAAGREPDVVLHLAGDGPERAALERLTDRLQLSDAVVFEGLLEEPTLAHLYRSVDAFVLPTFAEGVPIVLMEAMALEVPCISTWVSGVPELVEHGRSGWLVPPGDVEALTAAIAGLRDDAPLRAALGREGRRAVLDRYDVNRNVRQLAAVFARRLGEPTSPSPINRPATQAV